MYIGYYMIDKSENICLLIKSCAQYYCGKYEDTFKACIDFLSEYMRAHPKSDITVQAYFDLEERVVKRRRRQIRYYTAPQGAQQCAKHTDPWLATEYNT